jgi:hypothetical protein
MVPTKIPHRRLTLPAILAAFSSALAIGANIWFYRAHKMPPTFDDAWYLEISARLYHALTNEGLSAFYHIYSGAFKFKAPLISVLPLPFFSVFGISLDSALCVNLAALVLLSFYVYKISCRIFNERAALLAVIISLTLPMLFGLSRRFLVEYPLTAIVTASLYYLLASENFHTQRENRRLGGLVGIGLLLKVLYPFYLIGPAADTLWQRYKKSGEKFWKEIATPFRTIFYIAVPIALTWYVHNLIYVVGYIFRASVGDIASHYGDTNVFSPAVIFKYLNLLIADGPSYYYVVLFIIIGTAALKASSRGTLQKLFQKQDLRALCLWIAIPLAFTTFGVNKDIRFLTPSLPAFAILLAGVLENYSRRLPFPKTFLLLILLFPVNQYIFQTCGNSLLPEMQLGSIQILKPATNYSGPPGASQISSDKKLQYLVDLIQDRIGRPATIAIGTEIGELNANNLAFFSARKDYELRFISYGYAYQKVERTIARLRDKNTSHILLIEGLPSGLLSKSVKKIDDELRLLIKKKRLPFRKTATLPLSPGITAALFERTGAILMIGAIKKE